MMVTEILHTITTLRKLNLCKVAKFTSPYMKGVICMKKFITTAQKEEISKLANEGHYEALIAYGADMYSDGIRKGAIIVIVSTILGSAIIATVDIVKRRKKKKTQEN